jgi:aminoacrylate hydrolase
MPTTERADCRLKWDIQGDGPPLVLAAGLGGTASWWHRNIPALARHFTVLSFDQRGTRSLVPVASVEQMTADVISILGDARFERVAFLGHSTGGAIGVATALDYPNRLSSLVVYASTTCGDPYRSRILGLRSDLLKSQGARAYAWYTALLLYPPYWINATAERLDEMEAAAASQLGNVEVQTSRIQAILNFDRRSHLNLNRLALPTMVLCCADDILTPAYFSREYAELLPQAELVLVSRGGHAYAQTEPDEFNRRVRDFLSESRWVRGR